MNSPRPTRRTLTRTVAWSVPVVTVAAAAPAFAASPCNCPEFYYPGFPASGQSGNGWTISSTGGTSGGGTDQFDTAKFVTVADPPANGSRTVSASRSICVSQGSVYRFNYGYTAYLQNTLQMTSVLQVNGVTLNGSTINTLTSGTSGTRAVTWTANTTGNVNLAFVHSTTALATVVLANDITILNFTTSCAAI
jgi:hypothetical protein